MRKENIVLKWIAVGTLYLSVLFFFLPYHRIDVGGFGSLQEMSDILNFTPISIINLANKANDLVGSLGGNTAGTGILVWGSILFYIVPVVMTLGSAVMLSLKSGKNKYVSAVFFSAVAVILYAIYFTIIGEMGEALVGNSDIGFSLGLGMSDFVNLQTTFWFIANMGIAVLGVILPLFNIGTVDRGNLTSGQRYVTGNTEGNIRCIAGLYQNVDFPINNNEELILGRDGSFAHIILDQNTPKISRKHCSIRYDRSNNSYTATDFSANGTFVVGRARLVANSPTLLSAGSVIYLGNKDNQFRLGWEE